MTTSRTGTGRYKRLRRAILRPGSVCWLCGEPILFGADPKHPLAPTLDHVTPFARGGKDERENLRPAHRKCNRLKSDKAPMQTPITSQEW